MSMKKIKLVAVICCILCIYILAENAGNYSGNDTNACSEAFNVNVYEPESYYMMKGSIPGNMLGGGYKRIAASFAKILQSDKQTVYEKNNIYIDGYSPLLGKGIFTGNEQINYQVLFTFNELRGKTEVIFGTPVIADER